MPRKRERLPASQPNGTPSASNEALPCPSFWEVDEACRACRDSTYSRAGPRSMLECDCCQAVFCHAGCDQPEADAAAPGPPVRPGTSPLWHCSQACAKVAATLIARTGQRAPVHAVGGSHTTELARYSHHVRGGAGSPRHTMVLRGGGADTQGA